MNRLPSLLKNDVSYTKQSAALDVPYDNLVSQLPIDALHRIYYPTNFTPSYEYPLVIWLHSDQSSEMEVDSVMDSLSDQNYIAVAPRANIRSSSARRLYRWGDTRTDYAFAEESVWDCIMGAVENLPVAADRVFIAGFGRGGTLAQWIGLQYAERVAGVVSLSGIAPPISASLSKWKCARELPLLFAQRQGSNLCDENDLKIAMQLAQRAGLNYTFWQLQDQSRNSSLGDELSTTMLAAANRFMMGIVTGSSVNLNPEPSRDHLIGPFGIN